MQAYGQTNSDHLQFEISKHHHQILVRHKHWHWYMGGMSFQGRQRSGGARLHEPCACAGLPAYLQVDCKERMPGMEKAGP